MTASEWGLSVVVQLLDQIGGRLEVMSRPDAGTTFWVYLPVVARVERRSILPELPASTAAVDEKRQLSAGGALTRVVTIRKSPA